MLRNFSTRLRRGLKERDEGNGTKPEPTAKPPSNTRRFSSLLTNGSKKEKEKEKEKEKDKEDNDDHAATREDVDNAFEQFAHVLHASLRPLPNQTGDGSYIDKAPPSGIMADLRSLGFKDLKTLKDVMESKAKGDLVDDKTYIMERIIQLVAALPAGSKNRVELTNAFVNELWNTLQHPPLS